MNCPLVVVARSPSLDSALALQPPRTASETQLTFLVASGTRTGIIGAIVERCPGWERQRRAAGETPLAAGDGGPGPGGTASPDLGLALRKLGDLALTALRREQHLFSKVRGLCRETLKIHKSVE